jgi:asparagine synthase (glutamine-hydrolysing)
MTVALEHRGPDGEGIFAQNSFSFGHRRLSIIDIEGGRQPMSNENGSIVVITNGEIYNYIELREELILKGHLFRTRSDTEVIVHLYEEEGTEMFSRMNGMFALAVADFNQKKLILARDRLGKKPLFYYADKEHVVFASEIKSLILHPSVPRELDDFALYDYLSFNYIPGERTMFKQIKRIPPDKAYTSRRLYGIQ